MPEEAPPSPQNPKPVAARFLVARATLRFDRFMTHAIKIGGVGIIVAVFGIFVFILSQIHPLFHGATVEPRASFKIADAVPKVIGIDEWSELPFSYFGGREVFFTDTVGDRGTFSVPAPLALPLGEEITAVSHDAGADGHRIVVGTSAGRFGAFTIRFTPTFDTGEKRTIVPEIKADPFYAIGKPGVPVADLDYGDSGTARLAAAIQEIDGAAELHVVTLKQKRSLLGAGEIALDLAADLTAELPGPPQHLLVSGNADSLLVASRAGEVTYFFKDAAGFGVRQQFTPFEDLPDPGIARMDFVFGDVSVVFASATGEQRIFSLFRPGDEPTRLFGRTKTLPALDGPPSFYVASRRNKAFLCGAGSTASLRYSTSASVRWQQALPFEIRSAAIDGKFENLAFLDTTGTLHLYSLHDPHPEAGWKAFFGKVWYEGASKPEYVWQSSSASDDSEPKLSMTPLIIGSLKGTLYAMIFAVPVGLLAAVYTAQFLQPAAKKIVKPTMEIMASLPSVVLGFLGALWLAPIIETRVPSILLMVVALPSAALLFGKGWSMLPVRTRSRVKPGREWIAFAPVMLFILWAMWELGPLYEEHAFFVRDPVTGRKTADFRLWWPAVTGASFDQRNALVVGFMMGFAVIPVIFTIAEDALSNVPPSLTAASAALGASRWQTVRTVVIPIASAGIFSALMIGFGRAVGETMIVVMATGNTPIMEWNIFSGMRTLSANIAVELPEAPVHSTHYRTLFLGAMVLFLLTFVLNTVAEILRQHLREKFKLI